MTSRRAGISRDRYFQQDSSGNERKREQAVRVYIYVLIMTEPYSSRQVGKDARPSSCRRQSGCNCVTTCHNYVLEKDERQDSVNAKPKISPREEFIELKQFRISVELTTIFKSESRE